MKEKEGCSPIGRIKQLFSREHKPRVIEEFSLKNEEFTGDEGRETTVAGETKPGKNGKNKGEESWF